MNDPRDNASSGPQPRKPRIEVLQPGPGAAPAPHPTQGADAAGVGAARPATSGPSPAQASGLAGPPRQAEAAAGVRRRGLSRSPTTLMILLACMVIAGFLLYTYLSSERGVEASDKGTQLSSEDADLVEDPEAVSGPASTGELMEAPDVAGTDDGVAPEPEPEASSAPEPSPKPAPKPAPRPAPPRAAAPEAQPEVVDRPEAPPAVKSEAEAEVDAVDTVQSFYSALSAGDGASAARFVIPAKRASGPLSAGALTSYYSSFRRPLRLRRVAPVNADTVRVAYDYVLADGRVCRGQAVVDVDHRGGRSLVSGIRTRGPC